MDKLMERKVAMSHPLNYQFVHNIKNPGRYFFNETGLHLLVTKNINKYWIFRFMMDGKRQDMSLGKYPQVTIADVRKLTLDCQIKLSQMINPLENKRQKLKQAKSKKHQDMPFKDFAKICIQDKSSEWKNPKHHAQWINTINMYANPIIGDKSLSAIDVNDILKILKPIWVAKTETASRLRGRIEWILASATTRGLRSGVNPAQWRGHLETLLPKPRKISKRSHHAAMHFSDIPSFIEKLRYKDCLSALALEFTILTASRTSEVVCAKKSEITDDVWTIPANRMKAGKDHSIPLTSRMIEIIQIASKRDPDSEYIFSDNTKKLSNMAMLSLLKRLNPNMTVHGFRSSFRDWVSETTNFQSELAEMALAHSIKSQTEAAYRRGNLLTKRRDLMNAWEKYCHRVKPTNVRYLATA